MPAKVKVRIVSGRDLPVMDRASDLTDAFVEVKFGSTTHKTDVCRKSLNPQWNSDWYRFEVDDEDLQDEPLQLRVLDHDTYSSHDAIGKVYIDLNPLLSKENASMISGWFPIYDTMHGIRGELHVIVKVDLFSDFNKFRQSSCGVQFFCTSGIPHGYVMLVIYGFVEELVVNDDPEYQWIDKLRSQRASNEARQIHFTKLSGQLQRKIGLKVLEMGGNAVIGYRQCFDLEGESGVVVRGIGTSVMIAKTSGLVTSPPSASPIKDSVFCPTTPSPIYGSSYLAGVSPIQHRANPLDSSATLIHRTNSLPVRGGGARSSKNLIHPVSPKAVFKVSRSPSPIPPASTPLAQPISTLVQITSAIAEPHSPINPPPSPLALSISPLAPSISPSALSVSPSAPGTSLFGPPSQVISKPTSPLPILPPINSTVSPTPGTPSVEPPTPDFSPPSLNPTMPTLALVPPPAAASGAAGGHRLSPVHGLYGVGCSFPVPEDAVAPSSPSITPTKLSTSPAKIAVPLGRRSSDSEIGTPPKDLAPPEVKRRASVAGSGPVMMPASKAMSPPRRDYLEVPENQLPRRSSDTMLSDKARGSSLAGSSGSGSGGGGRAPFHRPPLQQQSIDMLEYPFFTMKSFSPGFLVHIGGVVAARSVKLLDRIHNPESGGFHPKWKVAKATPTPRRDEPETRDNWWTELRTEIRSHARALGCHAVIGYSEQTTICDEIIILSAMGTAAIVNLRADPDTVVRNNLLTMSLDRTAFDREKDKEKKLHVDVNLANQAAAYRMSQLSDSDHGSMVPQCSLCHIPYNENSLPYPVNLSSCCVCRRNKVPDMLFTTIEPPAEFPLVGKGCLLQARICRPKREAKGETNAKEISDSLPFMEYELHCQLQNKLKVKGMNTLFGLKVQVVVGERMLVAVATATAVYAGAMPPPPLPKVLGKIDNARTEAGLADMRRKIIDVINRNKELYHLYPTEYPGADQWPRGLIVDGDSEDEQLDIELSAGNKDTFVLEIDDAEDAAVVQVLLDPPVPDGFDLCSTENMPGNSNVACNLQMFTRVWRGSLTQANNIAFTSIFDNILKSLFFKLRAMTPCCLCHLDFDVELHDEEDIQVSVTGICTGIGEPPSLTNGLVDITPAAKQEIMKHRSLHNTSNDNEEMMFAMDGVIDGSLSAPISMNSDPYPPLSRPAPSRISNEQKRIRYYSGPKGKTSTIELTPLSFIPGGRVESYLGHLNFFIIRETTSVRESGGLNGFMHSFVAEVMAICRAHVASLSGNALVAFQLSECVLDDNLHKNQSQCLVNVCGDVVQVLYGTDLAPLTSGSSSGGMQSVSPLVQDTRSGKRGGTPRSSPRNSPKPDHIRLVV